VIDLFSEQAISFAEAARALPRGRRGRPVSISCLTRWRINGVRLPSGECIRLEALRLGGRWVTTREAIQRFAERITPNRENSTPESRTPSKRAKAISTSERKLDATGL
jgi:hypothetical protein